MTALLAAAQRPVAENTIAMALAYRGGTSRPQTRHCVEPAQWGETDPKEGVGFSQPGRDRRGRQVSWRDRGEGFVYF